MVLLKEVKSLGWAVKFHKSTPSPVFLSLRLLPADWNVELTATVPEPCLSASRLDDGRAL